MSNAVSKSNISNRQIQEVTRFGCRLPTTFEKHQWSFSFRKYEDQNTDDYDKIIALREQ